MFLTRETGIVQGEELSLEEKKERAKQVTLTRILTDEDFKKIGKERSFPDRNYLYGSGSFHRKAKK
jgi:hypothetical protein